jgi:hypothetical protein
MILAFNSTLLHIGEAAQVPPASLPASYERESGQGWNVERRVDLNTLVVEVRGPLVWVAFKEICPR